METLNNLLLFYSLEKMKRGQIATENLIITGLVLSLVIVLFYFSSEYTMSNYRQRQAEDALGNLLITANAVHELGGGNKEDVIVNVPEDINFLVQQKELVAHDSSGDINASVGTAFDVIGVIPQSEGLSKVPVKAINSTLVKIGKWMYLLYLSKPVENFTALPHRFYIYGEDLDMAIKLLVNGINYPSVPVLHFNDTVIGFDAKPSVFNAPPDQIVDYDLAVEDGNGATSNSLFLTIYGSVS